MNKYDHIAYCEFIADNLKGIGSMLKSMGSEAPSEVDEKLSQLKGVVLVAIDDEELQLSLNRSSQLHDSREYVLLVIAPAGGDEYARVSACTKKVQGFIDEIVARMLTDYESGNFGLECLNVESIRITPCGPFADHMYGKLMTFSLTVPIAYAVNKEAWK